MSVADMSSQSFTQQDIGTKSKKKTYRMADEAAAECLFDRLRQHQQRAPDAIEVARTITARISARLTSHDKHVRQSTLEKIWDKQTNALQMLLTILETSRDTPTSTYITAILREALCLKQGKGKKSTAGNDATINKKRDGKKTGKENKNPLLKKAMELVAGATVEAKAEIKIETVGEVETDVNLYDTVAEAEVQVSAIKSTVNSNRNAETDITLTNYSDVETSFDVDEDGNIILIVPSDATNVCVYIDAEINVHSANVSFDVDDEGNLVFTFSKNTDCDNDTDEDTVFRVESKAELEVEAFSEILVSDYLGCCCMTHGAL